MKTIMKTHRLLSFGASKLAIVQAKNANEQAKLEANGALAGLFYVEDLRRAGKTTARLESMR